MTDKQSKLIEKGLLGAMGMTFIAIVITMFVQGAWAWPGRLQAVEAMTKEHEKSIIKLETSITGVDEKLNQMKSVLERIDERTVMMMGGGR